MSKLNKLREKVEQVIEEHSRGKADGALIRIVWGSTDVEDDQYLRQNGQQGAFLNYCEKDYELSLGKGTTPDEVDRLRISHFFDPETLPKEDARRLYNVFACCKDSVYPMLYPDPESDSQIDVCGVEVSLPLETITGKVLEDALIRVLLSAGSVRHWLVQGDEEGFDQWKEDRRWFSDDDDVVG